MGISSELAQKACDALMAYWTDDGTVDDPAVRVAEVLDEVLINLSRSDPSLLSIIDNYEERMAAAGVGPAPDDVPPDDYEDLADDSAAMAMEEIEDLAEAAFDLEDRMAERDDADFDPPLGDLAFDAARERGLTEHRSRD